MQRPLATVVVSGIVLSTLLTLFILPGLLQLLVRSPRERRKPQLVAAEGSGPQQGRLAGSGGASI